MGEDLRELVATALAQDRRTGLSDMLSVIARSVDAQACILWQEAPFTRTEGDPGSGELFVLADWVEGDMRSALYRLKMGDSATGTAILENRPVPVEDALSDSQVDRVDPFLTEFGVGSFCSIPIHFLDGKHGAINVYRNHVRTFTEKEIHVLQNLIELLPQLYQTISDRVSYGLVSKINKILHNTKEKTFDPVAKEICHAVADTFSVVEVSLFLNSLQEPKVFRMAGTTWDFKQELTKTLYTPSKKQGLTGFVLSERKPVVIFDLKEFDSDYQQIKMIYENITWGDGLRVRYKDDAKMGLTNQLEDKNRQRDQPYSFMAVPVIAHQELVGALRCCTVKDGPFYFSNREIELLQLVSYQIGQAWAAWLKRRELEEEVDSWKDFIKQIANFHRFVQKQIQVHTVNKVSKQEVHMKALRILKDVIPNAEILDVRLIDETDRMLFYAYTLGSAWDEGSLEDIQFRKTRCFNIDESPPTSAGAYVMQNNQIYLIADTADPPGPYSATFSDAHRLLVAPITLADEVYGVIDIRDRGDREFPEYAVAITELLGQQLGLYHYLFRTIEERRQLSKKQAQMFEDFAHQLRSPINQVYARSQQCVRMASGRLETQLLYLRGLSAKAKRATQGLGLFAQLTENRKIKIGIRRRLTRELLSKMLIETKFDQLQILDPARRLEIVIEEAGFDVLQRFSVEVDRDLLWHALNNLIDNAIKYSFDDSAIRIIGGYMNRSRFHITVINKGIRLTAAAVPSCIKRGWRSKSATRVVGDGSGIGLWIVDHIMKAHGGKLILMPTNRRGQTRVRLVFPRSVKKDENLDS